MREIEIKTTDFLCIMSTIKNVYRDVKRLPDIKVIMLTEDYNICVKFMDSAEKDIIVDKKYLTSAPLYRKYIFYNLK